MAIPAPLDPLLLVLTFEDKDFLKVITRIDNAHHWPRVGVAC